MMRAVFFLAAAAAVATAAAAQAGVTRINGRNLAAIAMARGRDATVTSNAVSYDNVPGARVTMTVPAGEKAVLLARFSAESACSGDPGNFRSCNVKIVAVAAGTADQKIFQPYQFVEPGEAEDFSFDSTDGGNETPGSWKSLAVDRSIELGPGSYTILVQYKTSNDTITFRIDDWHLTVMKLSQRPSN